MGEKAKKALIAMSGGVDSSVAAYLVQRQGMRCIGVTMKLFVNEDIGLERGNTCCSLADTQDARSVAYHLGMPFYVFNFTGDFKTQVIDRFVDAYQKGLTPNPCIDCNRYMKFYKLFWRMKQLDIDYLATGHYARVEYDEAKSRWLLKKAADDTKDQSYVLYTLTQEQLSHILFPLGGLRKTEVREIAAAQGFVNARKHDSQDICFVPDGDYARFIESYTETTAEAGDFINMRGEPMGRHKGLIRYTVGQRKGLGISAPEPLYVRTKNIRDNTVTLCEEKDLFTRALVASDFNWIAYDDPPESLRVKARVRYKQPEQWADVTPAAGGTARIVFDEPQRAICEGQAVVLYDGDTVVGGGTIAEVEKE